MGGVDVGFEALIAAADALGDLPRAQRAAWDFGGVVDDKHRCGLVAAIASDAKDGRVESTGLAGLLIDMNQFNVGWIQVIKIIVRRHQ